MHIRQKENSSGNGKVQGQLKTSAFGQKYIKIINIWFNNVEICAKWQLISEPRKKDFQKLDFQIGFLIFFEKKRTFCTEGRKKVRTSRTCHTNLKMSHFLHLFFVRNIVIFSSPFFLHFSFVGNDGGGRTELVLAWDSLAPDHRRNFPIQGQVLNPAVPYITQAGLTVS